jgi:surfactin synthase thioesterase subunit
MAELYPRLWFRRFRPAAPNAQLLLCLPHAGGVAGTFHELATHLAPKVDVLSVQYPGRQDRLGETPFRDLKELAEAIVATLPSPLPRSVSLLGHSFGALLGFEIAQHLISRGDVVDRVFLSAHGPQLAPRADPIHLLPQDAFIAAIRSFSGPVADLLLDPMIAELSLPSLIADLEAAETHAMRKDGHAMLRISALYGNNDPRALAQDLGRWRDFAIHGSITNFELKGFEGGHLYLLERSQELADYILQHLDVIDKEPKSLKFA